MDLVKRQLDLLLLAELNRGPGHGYALIERLRERSDGTFDYPEGSVYPALHRLERGGLLTSAWSTGAARRRRIYSIRRRGRDVLADHLREWRLFVRAVDRVVAPA
jgi:DNA-binding PadR family transcriptional regulator